MEFCATECHSLTMYFSIIAKRLPCVGKLPRIGCFISYAILRFLVHHLPINNERDRLMASISILLNARLIQLDFQYSLL